MIPYRTKRVLRRLLSALLTLAVVGFLVLLCWLLWLNRYVVYTRDQGAKLDFDLSPELSQGEAPVKPTGTGASVHVTYENPAADEENGKKVFGQISGYYVDLDTLLTKFDWVEQTLTELPEETAILLDVKSIKSTFYYSTSLGNQAQSFDTEKLDRLIETLNSRGHYLIARIPAFQEYDYILENQRERVPYGLAKVGGDGSLWLDVSNGCYWMDPTSDGTIAYLIQIVTELRNMGFDEVVFSDFRFPDTDQVVFSGDRLQALNDTAATLVRTCATDSFAVSFTRPSADLTLPEGRTRLYLTGVSAADAASVAAAAGFKDAAAQTVFLTDSGDTRFEEFSVLRPLANAY